MQIRYITESEFAALALPILFHEPLYAHVYCVLMQDDATPVCKFTARSTLVQPIIKRFNRFIAIGIDETIGFWDFEAAKIAKQLALPYPFYDFYLSANYLFIVFELGILILHASTLSVCGELIYPNFIQSIEADDQQIKVLFLDGKIAIVNIKDIILSHSNLKT
ncbi:hypothetical protein LVJ82_02585 [Vitreoscilla massiliensis]|uniref:CheW-like domain-containing protein n=1 Tax=Vitreoscilla massiliensis TaxID=1689272 RepID=A0ABY4E309_9NEIS|nr:hypothetical protein [Vitreoscilla massiliensis]UOO89894.1 hypothetical protein LVJ82_02585 [Vitreoscilla massiliensis]